MAKKKPVQEQEAVQVGIDKADGSDQTVTTIVEKVGHAFESVANAISGKSDESESKQESGDLKDHPKFSKFKGVGDAN